MGNRRILVLGTDGFGGHGGIALHCRHLVRALSEAEGVERVTCINRVPLAFNESLPDKVQIIAPETSAVRDYLKLVAGALRGRWDLIVAEHIHLLPLAALLATRHRARLALVIHGFEAWSKPKRWLPGALRRVDQVISVSAVTRHRFLRWSRVDPARVTVIHNALEPGVFSPGAAPAYLKQRFGLTDQPVILTLGRLDGAERAKGFDETIRAVAALSDTIPDLRYLIAGDGDDRSRLEGLARRLGIGDRVTLTGLIAPSEKADLYRLADAFVMPSRLEGFGYVFLEAMACGLPVVGSTIDGSRDALLGGKLGQLIDPDNPIQLQSAIQTALATPKQVPDELDQFSLPRFTRAIQIALVKTATAPSQVQTR